jgi:hypothetical protein
MAIVLYEVATKAQVPTVGLVVKVAAQVFGDLV